MASFARKQAPRPRKKPRTASQLQQRINVLDPPGPRPTAGDCIGRRTPGKTGTLPALMIDEQQRSLYCRGMKADVISCELHAQFCSQMRAYRLYLGLSQARLAEKMRVQQPTICQLEGGRFTPTLETVEAVAKALGLSVERFLFMPPPPVPNKKLAVA